MTPTLRDYQSNATTGTAAVRARMIAGNRRVLLQCPTGGGKSYIAASVIKDAVALGRRVIFQVHRGIILDQQARTLQEWGVDYGWYRSGKSKAEKQVTLGTVATIANRIESIRPPDLIITDEAHHAGASTIFRTLDAWDQAYSMGLSATPCRLDGKPIGNYQDMVVGPSMRWLIDNKRLAEYDLYAAEIDKTTLKKTSSGDYSREAVAKEMESGTIYADSVKTYKEFTPGAQGLVFSPMIDHAVELCDRYKHAGFNAAVIHGKQPPSKINAIVSSYRSKLINILVSVDLVGEGFDVPGIEVVSICNKTASLARYLQWVGRGLRVNENGRKTMIFDHGGNYELHGAPCEERIWSLSGKVKTAREENKESAPQYCPTHFLAAWPGHPCSECGWLPKIKTRAIKEVEAKMVKIEIERARRDRKQEEGAARTLEELIALGAERGYKPGWAHMRWMARQRRR